MKSTNKKNSVYKTIGEATKQLGLIDKNTGRLQTHTIRYWQSQFKQIKPSIKAGKRRYFSEKDIKIIRHIQFLLKEKGLTISGVKKLLSIKKSHSIDATPDYGVYKSDLSESKSIKDKIRNISKIVKELKKIKNG